MRRAESAQAEVPVPLWFPKKFQFEVLRTIIQSTIIHLSATSNSSRKSEMSVPGRHFIFSSVPRRRVPLAIGAHRRIL